MNETILLEFENHQITIKLDNGSFTEPFVDSLPFESQSSTWGNEIYFAIPMEPHENGNTTMDVSVGDVTYWPEGNSLAIFYGSTPHSEDEKPVPADEVEIVGSIKEGLDRLPKIKAGESVTIKRHK